MRTWRVNQQNVIEMIFLKIFSERRVDDQPEFMASHFSFSLVLLLSEPETYTSTDVNADKKMCMYTGTHTYTRKHESCCPEAPVTRLHVSRLCHRPQIQPPLAKNLPCSGCCSSRYWGGIQTNLSM